MQRVIDCTSVSATEASWQECRRLELLTAGYQQFLGHDLANDLVALQGLARVIREQFATELDPEAAALLSRLADLAARADRRARRLAEFGRLLREPAWGPPVPLVEIVAEAVAEVRYAARLSHTGASASDAVFDVVEQMPIVPVSRRLLHTALVELLQNAIAASSAGSARVVVVATACEFSFQITLRDSGRGMDHSQLDRLGSVGGGAAGLGFFLVVQAVSRWRGRLLVSSEPREGTTVSILIPEKEV